MYGRTPLKGHTRIKDAVLIRHMSKTLVNNFGTRILKFAIIIATLARNSKPHSFPVWVWQAHVLAMVENRLVYTSGLTATTSDQRLSIPSNMGLVKQKT